MTSMENRLCGDGRGVIRGLLTQDVGRWGGDNLDDSTGSAVTFNEF